MKIKNQLVGLLIFTTAIPALAQDTNKSLPRRDNGHADAKTPNRRAEWTDEQRKEYKDRTYQFMEKNLTEIGVADEEKEKIRELQDAHREKMKANMARTTVAREKLSTLQKADASEAEIDAAIDEIAEAQGERMKILIRNQSAMKNILGKEKYEQLMDNARMQFRKEGRRGGSGLPPIPGQPPIPGAKQGKKKSPPPNAPPPPNIPPPPSTPPPSTPPPPGK